MFAAPCSPHPVPERPLTAGGGRVVIGGEATLTLGSDDPGYFNETDYGYNTLRNLRLGVSAEVRASERLFILGELRLDGGDALQAFALYARVRPWPARRFDLQVGRIPPTFGAFGRTTYGAANMLIGVPLAYQYLTSLRTDALPSSIDDLLRMRGRGWQSSFPLGNTAAARGLPLVNSTRYDSGVQIHGVNGMLEWTGAITTGSLANPRLRDDNDSRQLTARGVVRPTPAIAAGLSVARGAYLHRSVESVLAPGRRASDGVQQAIAADLEYSRGRFLTRGEVIRSTYRLPITLTSDGDQRLSATAWHGEGRYRIAPGAHLAVRVEHLGFSQVQTPTGLQRWEAPVRRVEAGGTYSLLRNVQVKASWQRNLRDAGRVRHDTLGIFQTTYWF